MPGSREAPSAFELTMTPDPEAQTAGTPGSAPKLACVWGGIPGPGPRRQASGLGGNLEGQTDNAAAPPARLQGGFYFLFCGCQVPEQIFSWSGGAA